MEQSLARRIALYAGVGSEQIRELQKRLAQYEKYCENLEDIMTDAEPGFDIYASVCTGCGQRFLMHINNLNDQVCSNPSDIEGECETWCMSPNCEASQQFIPKNCPHCKGVVCAAHAEPCPRCSALRCAYCGRIEDDYHAGEYDMSYPCPTKKAKTEVLL